MQHIWADRYVHAHTQRTKIHKWCMGAEVPVRLCIYTQAYIHTRKGTICICIRGQVRARPYTLCIRVVRTKICGAHIIDGKLHPHPHTQHTFCPEGNFWFELLERGKGQRVRRHVLLHKCHTHATPLWSWEDGACTSEYILVHSMKMHMTIEYLAHIRNMHCLVPLQTSAVCRIAHCSSRSTTSVSRLRQVQNSKKTRPRSTIV